MKIISLEIENVLNLRAVSIAPDGRVIRLTGKNGAGKSSVLNAMFYALAGKKVHAAEPIRRGEQRATVRVALGEDTVEVSAILRITASGATLDLEAPNGARFPKPQTMLDALIGQLSFDPQAFARMKPMERLDAVRGLVKLDIDVDALDQANQSDYLVRRDCNARAKSAAERVQAIAAEIDPLVDTTPVDVSALLAQMEEASAHNAAIEREAMRRRQRDERIETMNAQAGSQYERARELRRQADLAAAEGDKLAADALRLIAEQEKESALPTRVDVTEVRRQIDAAQKENAIREHQARQRRAQDEAQQELARLKTAADNLTAAMDARTAQKEDAIARANMPISGLGFGNGDVTYKGLPFAQASAGEQLRISTSIGMALNPKLRVLCIRDASLLDEDSLAMIEQMAEERDFQVWLETTQKAPTVGIHIVDGEVAAIDGEPVAREATAGV